MVIREIFGYCVEIRLEDLPDSVLEELRQYPEAQGECRKRIIVENAWNVREIAANPPYLSLHENGFAVNQWFGRLIWDLEDLEKGLIRVGLDLKGGRFENLLRKLLSMDYLSYHEALGQVIHEKILLPSTILFGDKAPLHGSAMYDPEGGHAVLITGAGGVGKTSLLIRGLREGMQFIADDMPVADPEGRIYPNLEALKVYAYNVEGDDKMRSTILSGRGLIDRLHWRIRASLSPRAVRRIILPSKLSSVVKEPVELGKAIFLIGTMSESEIAVERLKPEDAAVEETTIIKWELSHFLRDLDFYSLNSRIFGIGNPPEGVLTNIRSKYLEIFRKAEVYRILFNPRLPFEELMGRLFGIAKSL